MATVSTVSLEQQSSKHSLFADIVSLSDDEADADESCKDRKMLLSEQQLAELERDGFCSMHSDDTDNLALVHLVCGWVRHHHCGTNLIAEIINAIVYYHGPKFDPSTHVCLQSGGEVRALFLTSRLNLSLSGAFGSQPGDILDCNQVPASTLRHVLTWLGHHKGAEPDPLPCPVRSIHMAQIVSDPWDATWVDAFDKKTTFEVILAANYMDIKSLLHLGCAKVATLIKQMDQREINRIIEEEEKYQREHAQDTADDHKEEAKEAPRQREAQRTQEESSDGVAHQLGDLGVIRKQNTESVVGKIDECVAWLEGFEF